MIFRKAAGTGCGQTTFSVVRHGYDRAAVNDYLDEVLRIAAIGHKPDPIEIRDKTFAVVKNGYDRGEVHDYFDEIACELEARVA